MWYTRDLDFEIQWCSPSDMDSILQAMDISSAGTQSSSHDTTPSETDVPTHIQIQMRDFGPRNIADDADVDDYEHELVAFDLADGDNIDLVHGGLAKKYHAKLGESEAARGGWDRNLDPSYAG